MLFALVVMAGVLLLTIVFNNRREPSWWDSRLTPRKRNRAAEGQRGCSAVTPVVTGAGAVAGMRVGAAMVEAEPSGAAGLSARLPTRRIRRRDAAARRPRQAAQTVS